MLCKNVAQMTASYKFEENKKVHSKWSLINRKSRSSFNYENSKIGGCEEISAYCSVRVSLAKKKKDCRIENEWKMVCYMQTIAQR